MQAAAPSARVPRTDHPVDTGILATHRCIVSTKPRKAEEPRAAYAAKPAKSATTASKPDLPGGVRYATPEQARSAAEKVFRVHKDLFHRLAQ
jgi:hypothetical protein